MSDKTVAELMAQAKECARASAAGRADWDALEQAIRRAVDWELVAWMRTYSDGSRTLRWEPLAHPDAKDTPLYARRQDQ